MAFALPSDFSLSPWEMVIVVLKAGVQDEMSGTGIQAVVVTNRVMLEERVPDEPLEPDIMSRLLLSSIYIHDSAESVVYL